MMRNVFITSAVRTPEGKIGGQLKDFLAKDLAEIVLDESVSRIDVEKSIFDEVVLGQAKQDTEAPNIARLSLLEAGFPKEVPGYTVHRQCGSGMQAIINSLWQIQSSYAGATVAGGVESMSNAPYYLKKARNGYRSGNGELVDPNTASQPNSQPEDIETMGITAENLAEKFGIEKEEQDKFAYNSHEKAVKAIDEGKFDDEMIPLSTPNGMINEDERPRRKNSLEKLSSLKPVFKDNGTVTAGNSSSRDDQASAVTVMAEEKLENFDIDPLVRVVSAGVAGVDPEIMGIGPVEASRKALRKSNLQLDDIGLVEVNEAFAAQTLAVVEKLGLDKNKLNVNGGAIALGHALGCSGTRIVVTLVHEMLRRNVKYGLASICIAGGLGTALILENPHV